MDVKKNRIQSVDVDLNVVQTNALMGQAQKKKIVLVIVKTLETNATVVEIEIASKLVRIVRAFVSTFSFKETTAKTRRI